jgi:hypothetical protein
LFDEGARKKNAAMLLQASRLADASRQNVLAAFELAARSAQARPPKDDDAPWLAAPAEDEGE